ncbi:Superoxide dismutase [Fe] [Campylobacter jejuni]|nr:Superoxide dismutase [Fe] [Campylobacter jejuni]
MFELRKLLYDTNAFGDFLSAETFSYHHGKHHNTYVTNLNNLIKDTEFAGKDLVSIIKTSNGAYLITQLKFIIMIFILIALSQVQAVAVAVHVKV